MTVNDHLPPNAPQGGFILPPPYSTDSTDPANKVQKNGRAPQPDSFATETVDASVKKTFFDQDRKDMILSVVMTFVTAFKISMATLLAVFVPQYCVDRGSTCSFSDNFTDLTSFNKFVLFWNFLTLFVLVSSIFVALRRERWLIEYLDFDPALGPHHLPNVLPDYPHFGDQLRRHNRISFSVDLLCLCCMILNAIFSAVLVFGLYYDGFRTITVFLTNSLLIAARLLNSTSVNYQSWMNDYGLSLFKTAHVSFNVIDADHVHEKQAI
eukprot:GILK01010222.1.p1 GENE.GILK01010222.1~~GILK01010222.1.p1  ORF type:complete len:267 (-),score=26.56 GILK01010222.1:112-912(-)